MQGRRGSAARACHSRQPRPRMRRPGTRYGFPVSFERVIQYRSASPWPPGLVEKKISSVRLNEMAPRCSMNAVLIGAPMFTGGPHGSDVLLRVDTHRSKLGGPAGELGMLPVRFEVRNSSSPSRRGIGKKSPAGVLSSGTWVAGPN